MKSIALRSLQSSAAAAVIAASLLVALPSAGAQTDTPVDAYGQAPVPPAILPATETPVPAVKAATAAPSAVDSLPITGADARGVATIAAASLAVGGVFVVAGRRKRTAAA